MATYTMALTRRHDYPKEVRGTIYPAGPNAKKLDHETHKQHDERLDMWAELMIPEDCTILKVYMSGYKALWRSLIRVCKKRDIRVTYMFPRSDKIRKKMDQGDLSVSRNTACYREFSKLTF